MAKIVLVIQDNPDGNTVGCTAEPSFEMMMNMLKSGTQLTAAHGYALYALNKIREKSSEEGPKNILHLPKARRFE